jgi:flagellar basal-body rod modification protein FlgD
MSVSNISESFPSVLQDRSDPSQEVQKEDPLGRDAFLKMLIAQLEHQDPLNPMQGADFSAQLAQFSSLEQLFQVNSNLETMATSLEPKGNENVLDYIGKKIFSEDNNLQVVQGKITGGLFTLEQTEEIVVSIYDDIGREVITLYPGKLDGGIQAVEWNGYDRTGVPVPDGNYRFELTAVGEGGAYVPIQPAVSGTVTGVTYENGMPYLDVDGRLVDPSTVIKVKAAG